VPLSAGRFGARHRARGLIANRIDPAMDAADDNIATLRRACRRRSSPTSAGARKQTGASVAPEALQTLGIR
jgi:hypothetical protein